MIQLRTRELDGSTRTRTAGQDATLEEVETVAETEFYGGLVTYAAVLVDGAVYSELEE